MEEMPDMTEPAWNAVSAELALSKGRLLPAQFDDYFRFYGTRAVAALGAREPGGPPDTYPFGL